MIRDLPLYLRARAVLAIGGVVLAWSGRCHRWADAATDRASALSAHARQLAYRLQLRREARRPLAPGDLLFGSRAIAAHLGLPKGTAKHLIRSRAIPWFPLAGAACARRSTLAAHFAALEARASQRDGLTGGA